LPIDKRLYNQIEDWGSQMQNISSQSTSGRYSPKKSMTKVVIFCQSYTQIKATLYLMKHYCHRHSVTLVILGHQNLFKYFETVNKKLSYNQISIIYIARYQKHIARTNNIINNLSYLLPDLIGERRHLRDTYTRYFAELSGAQIHFFSQYFADYIYYLLKRLSKSNRLVHIPDPAADLLLKDSAVPTNIIDLARLAIMKLVFGWDLVMSKHLGNWFPYIPDKFFQKKAIEVIRRDKRDEMLREIDLSKFQVFNVNDYDVIYFCQNALMIRQSRETFKRELAEIFRIICKYFPENKIAVKYHPRGNSDKTIINAGDVLEDFIPAECLYSENVKMYLTPYSTSIANVERGLAVSLIDLISVKNEKVRQNAKERLLEISNTEILFPKSLDEFEMIVANLKHK